MDKVSNKRAYNFKDLTGKKFNKLLVIALENAGAKGTFWKCKCDCGNIKIVNAAHLKDGHTKSCGCIRDNSGNKNPSYKHGLRHTRIYSIWVNIKTRCNNDNNENYKDYGKRGIKICDEWLDKENGFINFYNWAMANGYQEDLTIDRINVNGNYEPSNCRWADMIVQQNNRRSNHFIEYRGEKHTLEEWSKILPINISSSLLRYRIVKGWDIEKAFTKKVNRKGTI